ncbi:MAG: thioredoxin [Acidobacteriota bacterium]|nr:thioredoxin [Acidobacteriota bacterium]
MPENIIVLDEANFDQETSKEMPIVVDFWATWCAPCRLIAPHLEALAKEYEGRVRVGKVDVDQNGSIATRFQIRSIPTLLVFKDGQTVDQLIGMVPKDSIQELIDKHVS